MDIKHELRSEYDTLHTILQNAIGDRADAELPPYIISCWCLIWNQNQHCCSEYTCAVEAVLGYAPTMAQMRTALQCCGNSSQTLVIPSFFLDLIQHSTEKKPDLPQQFLLQLNQLLISGAYCNGDFTIPEANTVSSILQHLIDVLRENGLPFDLTLLKTPSTTAPNEPSYVLSDDFSSELSTEDVPEIPEPEQPVSSVPSHPQKAENKSFFDTFSHSADPTPLTDLLNELDSLVGLSQVKQDVHSLTNFIQLANLRKMRNLKVPTISYHLVFTGNPGTGKTTIARLISQIYHQMGILSKGQLVEADRSSLVGGYQGQTAIKTQGVIQSALGGVLFIDEAYSLVNGEQDSYGQEAIETLLKAMEDHRDELVVIVAGYDELMHKFIRSNPGLASRFNKYFHFPDYNGNELLQIFLRFCRTNDYQLQPGLESVLLKQFECLYETRSEHFGNARSVRNLFEKVIGRQADRLAFSSEITETALMTLTVEDFEDLWKEL